MPTNIGPKIGVEGEGEFKKSIAQINNNIKTLTAETKAVTSAFIGEENSMAALTAKNKALSSQNEALNNKLDIQKKLLQELKDQGVDPASAKYQKLLQDLYKTEAEFNANEAEIKKNTEQLKNNGLTAEEVARQQEEAAEKAKKAHEKWGSALQVVAKGLAALTAAAGAAVAAIGKLTIDAGYAADDINTMSKVTGLSTEEIQKFQYASEKIDVSLDTLTGSMSKLTKNMASARDGSGAASDAFKKLGVSVTDGNGEFRDRNEVFQETIAALGEISNETERDALAMEIFGKSAQDLNPLILGGAEALKQLGDEASEAGLILNQDALDKLNTVSDAMDTFKATTSAAGRLLATQFAGPVSDAINTVTGYIQKFTKAFASGDWSAAGEAFNEVISDMASKMEEFLPRAIEFGSNLIIRLSESILSKLPTILKTGIQVLLTVVKGLSDTLPELIPVAIEAILTIVDTLTSPDMLGQLIDAALELILALAFGLIDALPELIAKAPEIIENLVTAIIRNAPKLLSAAVQLIIKLGEGIVNSFFRLREKAEEIVDTIKEKIVSLVYKLRDAGKQLLEGLWNGIKDKVEWLKSKVSGVVDTIKGWFTGSSGFDEHSPSKWSEGVGVLAMAGLGNGFEKGVPGVQKTVSKAMDKFKEAFDSGAVAAMNAFERAVYKNSFVVKAAEDANEEIIKEYGAAADEALEYQKRLLQERIAYEELAKEIRDVDSALQALDSTQKGSVLASAINSAQQGMRPNIKAPDMSLRDMMAGTVNGIQTAMGAFTGGNINIKLQLNGRTLAENTVEDYISVARANGTPILNPAF